jgi:succinate dehydrogenase/fumarate reductase cytochrome b subunit
MSIERFRGYLRILRRIALVILIIIVADVIGLGVLFYAQGRLQYFSFMESLIVLLLLEGCIVGAAGGLMYIGFGAVWGARREAPDPTITQEGLKNRKERRESQQQWTVAMVTVGLLMILIAFLTSSIAQI